MANGSNAPRYSWQDVVDAIAKDTLFGETLNEVAKVAEVGPRAPVVLYLQFKKDVGVDGLNALPEPGSNQKDRTNGLNFRVSEGEANDRDADPRRLWDRYYYKLPTNEILEGRVYNDMADRHPLGVNLRRSIGVIEDWMNVEKDKAELPKTINIDGIEENIQEMPTSMRLNRKSMLLSRLTRIANNMRLAVEIHRNVKAIETFFKGVASVGFVYVKEDKPASGLARVTETIRVIKLNTDKDSPRFGQETTIHESFSAKQFINLDPLGLMSKDKKFHTYDDLIDSKRVKAAKVKKGQGQTKDAAEVSGLITTNNFSAILANFRIFAEQEKAKQLLLTKLNGMSMEDRQAAQFEIVEVANFLNSVIDKDMLAVHRSMISVNERQQQDALAAKNKAEEERRMLEQQPTQHERNAQQEPKQFITTEDAERMAREKLLAQVQDPKPDDGNVVTISSAKRGKGKNNKPKK